MYFRGSQNKDHVGRRLLQGFEQGIKGTYGKHMYLIDNINLIFSFRRRVGHLIHNLSDIVHTIVGGRVNFDHIHAGSRRNGAAAPALPAGSLLGGLFTVYCFGEYLRHRSFSGSAGARKKVRMTDTVGPDLILQGRHNMVLPLYVRQGIRAELPV